MTTHTSDGESPRDEMPRVSVIIPVYNVADTLPTTAPSWLVQDHAELLIVDDGSTDGSYDQLRALTCEHSSVRLLRHEHNRGRAAARNTGMAAATGDVLLFLDADMRPEPDFVRQHALLHRNPAVIGVVSNPILEGLDPAKPYHHYLRVRQRAVESASGAALPFRHFIIGYTSVKVHAVRAVGGFDERFTYGEDLDFAYRLASQYEGGLVRSDLPVVHHYDHGTLDDRLRKLHEFGRDNLPLLLKKHPGIADAAHINFVDSEHGPASLAGRLKRWSLVRGPVAPIRSLLPYVPLPVSYVLLRYLMAATIAEAFRLAPPTYDD